MTAPEQAAAFWRAQRAARRICESEQIVLVDVRPIGDGIRFALAKGEKHRDVMLSANVFGARSTFGGSLALIRREFTEALR